MLSTAPRSIAITSIRQMDETRAMTGATRLISVVNAHLMPATPEGIAPCDHLRLPISDARAERGEGRHVTEPLIARLIEFVRAWPRDAPLLIHCFSGLNRSPAAAYIALAVLNPDVPESLIAYRLRAASETAAPNPTMIGVADVLLGRNGNLKSAIDMIGPGAPAAEGRPFSIISDFGSRRPDAT